MRVVKGEMGMSALRLGEKLEEGLDAICVWEIPLERSVACLAIVKLEENMIYGSVFCMALIPPYVIRS